MGTNFSSSRNTDLKRSNVKLQAQQISMFNGDAIKWRSWKKRTRAAIGTAGMLEILDSADYANRNSIDNETVFHLLQVATADGNAAHLVDSFEDQKDGHAAYSELVLWYEGDELTNETAEDVRAKLDKIMLNTKTSASEYINYFQLYTKQLTDLGESYTESKTVQIFLSQITDPDYETTREFCVENRFKITDCIERIRAKERRFTRDRMITRTRSLNVRRTDMQSDHELVDMEKYINENGYYSLPQEKWDQLDSQTQAKVKRYNTNLRKKRKYRNNNNPTSTNNEDTRSITPRNTTNTKVQDDDSSPTKKLRTVTFKDDSVSNQDTPQPEKEIVNRRNEIISFQVQDE